MLIGLGTIIIAWPILKEVPPEILNITSVIGNWSTLDNSWQSVLVGIGVIVVGLLIMAGANLWNSRHNDEEQ